MLEKELERELNSEELLKKQLKTLQEDLRHVNRAAEKDLSKKHSLEEKIGQCTCMQHYVHYLGGCLSCCDGL